MFKRLLPLFLVTILLAGLATAQAAGLTRTSHRQCVAVSRSQFGPGYDNPRFDFGTVVRDTSDENSIGADHGGIRSALQQRVPPNPFFTWSWLSLMLVP